jgi:uncharacterized protein (UPF0264 family)
MTVPGGLLVSVRSADEAAAAVAGGAAIIDVKEPARGPLGAADPEVAAAVAGVVGAVPWTLACGELAVGPEEVASHVRRVLAAGGPRRPAPVAVKAGPAGLGAAWRPAFDRLVAGLPAGIAAVAVAYADHRRADAAEPADILRAAADAGASLALVDTFDKSGPGVVPLVGLPEIRSWQRLASALGLRLAVAGRLTVAEAAAVARLGVWVVGVRSAACGGRRTGRVEAGQVTHLVDTLAGAAARAGGAPSGGHPS